MSQLSGPVRLPPTTTPIIGAVELSEKKWVLAAQLPGVGRHSRHALDACDDERSR
jgi:hypothetical protein